MMRDLRAGKTFQLPWWQWVEFCDTQGVNPYKESEVGIDLGGGDSYTVACYEKPSKEE